MRTLKVLLGCALLLPCAQTADWAQQRLWQAQCADEPPDVTYLDAGASLNLHEWRGRARVYRRWLCDALQGLPAVWEDTAADVVQCGPDPECLHDLVVVATRNWELALGDDAVVLVPGPSANASGPEPGAAPPDPPRAPPPPPRPPKPSLHKMEPQSTSGLQPLAPPVTVAVPAGPRHSKALRGAWTPELMRTVTSAMRLPAAALKDLQRSLYQRTNRSAVFVPLKRDAAGHWGHLIADAAADPVRPLRAAAAAALRAVRSAFAAAPPAAAADALPGLRRALVGHYSTAPGGPRARLDVTDITADWHDARAPAEARLVVLEELCGDLLPNATGRPAEGPEDCTASVAAYRAVDGAVVVERYLVPDGYRAGDRLAAAAAVPRPTFRPVALLRNPRRGAFFAATTAAHRNEWGTLDLWRHRVQFTEAGQTWTVERVADVVPRAVEERLWAGGDAFGERARALHVRLQRDGPPRTPRGAVLGGQGCGRRVRPQPLAKYVAQADGGGNATAAPGDAAGPRHWFFDDCALRQLLQNMSQRPQLHCAFIHGAGGANKDNAIVEGSLKWYWGNIEEWTPLCKTHWFMDADTIYHGWDNPHIQDLVCETLLGPQARAPLQNPLDRGLVRHTAIMTHSMGNLLTTAALQRGKCRLEKDSTTWLSMSGPWHGAGAVTRLREVCADDGPANAPLRELANTLHFCVGKVPSHALQTIVPDYPGLLDLVDVARPYVTAVMCGDTPIGIPGPVSPGLAAIGHVFNLTLPHDGLLELSSCQAVKDPCVWGRTPESPFYYGSMNHADTSGRNGDFFHKALQPLEWVKNFYIPHRYGRSRYC